MIDYEMIGMNIVRASDQRQSAAAIGQWSAALDAANAEIRRLRIEMAAAKRTPEIERGKRMLATL